MMIAHTLSSSIDVTTIIPTDTIAILPTPEFVFGKLLS